MRTYHRASIRCVTEEIVKACSGCGGPIGKDNRHGYCNANIACKREAHRLASIEYRASKPGSHPGRGRGARYHGRPEVAELVYGARRRAKAQGFECTITVSDIEVPEFCPVLGIKLERGSLSQKNTSPSIDRIRNDRGYVPGNVWVISLKANRMKSDATDAELLLFASWISRHLGVNRPDGTIKAGTGLGG